MGHLTYEESAKRVRNRMRSYSAVSVVRHALELTQSTRNESLLDQLQTLPWITFLLVKLVLEDQMTPIYNGESCPKTVFDLCRQALWDAEKVPDAGDAKGSVYLMFRSLIQAQLPFQKKPTFDFLRWPALISRLDSKHPVRVQFENRLGMQPDVFICICYAIYAPVVNGDMIIKSEYFKPLLPVYGEAVEYFLSEFARDLPGLRSELRRRLAARIAANADVRPRQESFEFPWFSNYPLLRDNQHDFVIWHPLIFARGMEQAVHKRLSENRSAYAGSFSKVFEDYVLELIQEAGFNYLSEEAYKEVVGSDKHAVEAIITINEANVFVESKLTAYSEELFLSDRKPIVWKSLKRVREAMNQGWKVGSRLREGDLPTWSCASSKEDFLIIVTSQSMSCATGEHFQRMFNRDIFEPHGFVGAPTVAQLEKLPLINIVIVSIEEFEHLMGCVRNGEIDLVAFLREVAEAHTDPQTSVMFIDQMLGSKTKKWRHPHLIEDASQHAMGMLKEVLTS
jgi:hypothetical protein